MRRATLGLIALLAAATPAAAQSALALDVSNGRVTLDARDVPVAQILERWSRLAAITVLNSDKLPTARVTMRLDGVTPREALDLLLRDAGGYIAATRASRSGVGTELDRVLIVGRSGSQSAAPQRTVTRGDVRQPDGPDNAAERGDHETNSDSAQTTAEASPADREDSRVAEDSYADARPGANGGASVGFGASPSPPPINFGGPEPLINGLTLDQIRANGVRAGSQPPPEHKDANTYATQQMERDQQMAARAAEAAKSGPFGVKGATAQPGSVTQAPASPPSPAQQPARQAR